jgi:hypothetical protein
LILQPLVSWLVWSFENAAARADENKSNLHLQNPTVRFTDMGSAENSTHQHMKTSIEICELIQLETSIALAARDAANAAATAIFAKAARAGINVDEAFRASQRVHKEAEAAYESHIKDIWSRYPIENGAFTGEVLP